MARGSELEVTGVVSGAIEGAVHANVRKAPVIQIWDGKHRAGEAVCEPAEDGGQWRFSWQVPQNMLDGKPHDVQVRCGRSSVHFDFIGESENDAPSLVPAVTPAPPAALRAKADALRKQAENLAALLSGNERAAAPAKSAPRPAVDVEDRYGRLLPEAVRKRPGGRDFVWLGVIRYEYRHQRPQHLIERIADLGNRVIYIALKIETADERGRFKILANPHEGVFIVQLRVSGVPPKNIYGGFTAEQAAEIQRSLDELMALLNVTAPNVVVQYPSWYPVACGIKGATVAQDCLDYVGGFSNVPPHVVQLEEQLIRDADVVVTTSAPLAEHVAPLRKSTIVRNAADVEFFAQAADFDRSIKGRRPVIGYFGAISEWYRVGWIEYCAKAHPEWDFVLIGEVRGADVTPIRALSNVRLLGEQPYATLPQHLKEFDIAIIPFKLNDLIRCTNPVKLYEYMAAGKAVVASDMPEVIAATPLVYIAENKKKFEQQIAAALAEDTPELRRRRQEWTKEHTWENRAAQFMQAIDGASPPVSVVILAYNNWQYTSSCLHSVLTATEYPNLEVIVVDNASSDQTPAQMARIARIDSRVKYIRNEQNLGFAAGNNVGLKAASGEYLILLNNDTYVTTGWARDLIRPLMQSPKAGLAGPLTNNIGNEQKIRLQYEDMQQMEIEAKRFTRDHIRRRYLSHNLAFFCVATRRDVIEKVGLLDETYGRGFFEDDDYCRRVAAAGYDIVIADDVFVHHHLSASFNALGQEEKRAQMLRNKAIYEERWGPWKPHKYRDAPGFG